MTKPNKKAIETVSPANQGAQAQKPLTQEDLNPARCAIILIEAVDAAQKAGGVFTLEEAALLAACKKILLEAITPPVAETTSVQEEA